MKIVSGDEKPLQFTTITSVFTLSGDASAQYWSFCGWRAMIYQRNANAESLDQMDCATHDSGVDGGTIDGIDDEQQRRRQSIDLPECPVLDNFKFQWNFFPDNE